MGGLRHAVPVLRLKMGRFERACGLDRIDLDRLRLPLRVARCCAVKTMPFSPVAGACEAAWAASLA
ncbi:hypothetical protein D9M72_105460 [compost metagenome]